MRSYTLIIITPWPSRVHRYKIIDMVNQGHQTQSVPTHFSTLHLKLQHPHKTKRIRILPRTYPPKNPSRDIQDETKPKKQKGHSLPLKYPISRSSPGRPLPPTPDGERTARIWIVEKFPHGLWWFHTDTELVDVWDIYAEITRHR